VYDQLKAYFRQDSLERYRHAWQRAIRRHELTDSGGKDWIL